MFSVVIDGKVTDVTFKTIQDGHYRAYLGDMRLGQYFKLPTGWTALGDSKLMNGNIISVGGFKTRIDAVEYILRCYRIGSYK